MPVEIKCGLRDCIHNENGVCATDEIMVAKVGGNAVCEDYETEGGSQPRPVPTPPTTPRPMNRPVPTAGGTPPPAGGVGRPSFPPNREEQPSRVPPAPRG